MYKRSVLTEAYIFNLDSGGFVSPDMKEVWCKAAYTTVLPRALRFEDRKAATDAALHFGIQRYVIVFNKEVLEDFEVED